REQLRDLIGGRLDREADLRLPCRFTNLLQALELSSQVRSLIWRKEARYQFRRCLNRLLVAELLGSGTCPLARTTQPVDDGHAVGSGCGDAHGRTWASACPTQSRSLRRIMP